MAKTQIVKDEKIQIPVQIMEQSIVDVAKAARQLKNSRITQRAIVLLIQDELGVRNISKDQIANVLDAAAELDKVYLR